MDYCSELEAYWTVVVRLEADWMSDFFIFFPKEPEPIIKAETKLCAVSLR